MPASPPTAVPSQYDATQFHSEFGYLAPTIRFRRKVALTLKGGALGALFGAAVVFVVVMTARKRPSPCCLRRWRQHRHRLRQRR